MKCFIIIFEDMNESLFRNFRILEFFVYEFVMFVISLKFFRIVCLVVECVVDLEFIIVFLWLLLYFDFNYV